MRWAGALAAGLAVALAAGVADGRERGGDRKGAPHGPGWADPSDVLSAEIAFARLAREKGQWTAFRATAARGAQQFAPGPVRTADFLKGRKDPPAAIHWQPHAVWMACDGSYAVTRGAWQDGSQTGWFMTVWQRQDGGTYKWVLDQGGDLAKPLAAPDFLTAKVADCPPRRQDADAGSAADAARRNGKADAEAALPADWLSGHASDGSLAWTTLFGPDGQRTGARRFTVTLRIGGSMVEVASAEAGAGG